MIINLITAQTPIMRTAFMRAWHIWVVVQQTRIYNHISDAAPGLI
jgi:hypothetical protein